MTETYPAITIIATGKNSPNCQEEDLINPVADNYFSHESIYSLCQEEAINITDRDENGRFMKGHGFSNDMLIKMSIARKGKSGWNKGKRLSEEQKIKLSESHKGLMAGEKHPMYGKRGALNPLYGVSRSDEVKRKISLANKGKVRSEEFCKRISNRQRGKTSPKKGKPGTPCSEETRKKMSDVHKGKPVPWLTNRVPWNKGKQGFNGFWTGKSLSDEHKHKLSKSHIGLNVGELSPNWRGGRSFEPYCHKFNGRLKERIRERDNRTCQLCGTKENGCKLHVHHIHYDKPNCNPDLISLCRPCHCKVNFNRDYYENMFLEKLKMRGIL